MARTMRVLLDRHRRIARGEWCAPPSIECRTRWGAFRAAAFPQREPSRDGPPATFVIRLAQHLPRTVRVARPVTALGLSPGERQVAFHLATSKGADGSAAALGVLISTCRSYVERVYDRLDANSRREFQAMLLNLPAPHVL